MAYSASVTITHAGGRDYVVTISETEAAAASEATITGLPKKGLILSQLADKTAGSATTLDPKLTTATGSTLSTQTVIENGTAAATISNLADPAIPYYSPTGVLFHRSQVDQNSDSSVITVYLIRAGW